MVRTRIRRAGTHTFLPVLLCLWPAPAAMAQDAPVDVPPVAVADSRAVDEDSGPAAFDVRANDTDSDGGPMAIESTTNGAHGAVAITNSGAGLTYTPDSNYCDPSTSDSFTYTLNGGSTATVDVTVACVDDAPTAINDSRTVVEDASATTLDVRANDTDVDGGAKTIESKTNGDHGQVEIASSSAAVTYRPSRNYCGADSFTYALNGGDTATVRVTVACVDDAPLAVDDAPTVGEDSWAIFDLRANDTDIDAGARRIVAQSGGSHGMNAITAHGTGIVYMPDPNYCGPDTLTYTLNGGSTATVSVTVACAPENAPAADREPPETTIADGPNRRVMTKRRRANVTFAFVSSEPGSTYLCRIDDGQFKLCDLEKSYKLKPGRHTFWVSAIDGAGNADTTPVKKKFKVVRVRRRR